MRKCGNKYILEGVGKMKTKTYLVFNRPGVAEAVL